MSHFSVSLIVWAKSQNGVHKPHILKRKESRSGSNRGPSAYQPSALPLGHTGSLKKFFFKRCEILATYGLDPLPYTVVRLLWEDTGFDFTIGQYLASDRNSAR